MTILTEPVNVLKNKTIMLESVTRDIQHVITGLDNGDITRNDALGTLEGVVDTLRELEVELEK